MEEIEYLIPLEKTIELGKWSARSETTKSWPYKGIDTERELLVEGLENRETWKPCCLSHEFAVQIW